MNSQDKTNLQQLLSVAHNQHQKELKAHAMYKTNNHETCEDLVQETFLKTWKYLVNGGKIEMMKSFLFHVLNDLIVDEYRKHKTSSLDAILSEGFEPLFTEQEQLLDILDGKTAIKLINKLPEKYKTIMNMRYVHFFSLKEISLATNQSLNTVAVQAHRGLKKLKELYKPVFDGLHA